MKLNKKKETHSKYEQTLIKTININSGNNNKK